MPALIVFSESIKYLKQSLLDDAMKQQTDIQLNDIKWIVTVPAIWSDPAKVFMRRAAVEVFNHFHITHLGIFTFSYVLDVYCVEI